MSLTIIIIICWRFVFGHDKEVVDTPSFLTVSKVTCFNCNQMNILDIYVIDSLPDTLSRVAHGLLSSIEK